MIKSNNKGITLLEIVFSVSVFTLIIIGITLFARNVWVYNSFIQNSLITNDYARETLKTMTKEIRTASTSSNGAYAINEANSTSFIFFSDVDSDGVKERIRYYLYTEANGTKTLKRGLIEPTGSPYTYTGTETNKILAKGVTNTNIFEYYDRDYDGTTSPLSSPVNIPLIRLVKVNLTIDQDPNKDPGPTSFSTQVSLRNLKDNF